MKIKSKLTGIVYSDEDSIRIPNPLQAYKYMTNGLEPIDLIYTDRLVFVFNRFDSKEYFDKWCKRTL